MYDLLHQRGCIVISMCNLFGHSYEPVHHSLLHCTFSKGCGVGLSLLLTFQFLLTFYLLFYLCYTF
ncbi:hypothetical protein MtrunA17_Chr2g0298591 [Medicago truncatula]|uniref:Transmembrane protein n=1 Tax=Medicago truncatula TaxID=3880 RepID=A0A396JAK8_MEDTR|nr:hypothetical protein MtrunA17_Chr2g0298591 [Medicago truncatula]